MANVFTVVRPPYGSLGRVDGSVGDPVVPPPRVSDWCSEGDICAVVRPKERRNRSLESLIKEETGRG